MAFRAVLAAYRGAGSHFSLQRGIPRGFALGFGLEKCAFVFWFSSAAHPSPDGMGVQPRQERAWELQRSCSMFLPEGFEPGVTRRVLCSSTVSSLSWPAPNMFAC